MAAPRVLLHAPAELTSGRLQRLGEGIGKVVYASDHWVVKRPRTPSEIIALILLWKLLPRPLLKRPTRPLRFLRVCLQAAMRIVPASVWLSAHVKDVWRIYRSRDLRGERLARTHLEGSPLVPEVITFPPTQVQVGGFLGCLTVTEATARVEANLHDYLSRLRDPDQIRLWLGRFLELRQSGWQRGLFSLDAHLKNFGVAGDRIVLLDPGGLTDRWDEVHERLVFEEVVAQPHVQLGLGPVLSPYPSLAAGFDRQWKEIVNRESVLRHWPRAGATSATTPAVVSH